MSTVDRLKRVHEILVRTASGAPVVFHHVPKCGGTSVGRALRFRYIVSQATVHPIHSFRAVEAYFPSTDRDGLLCAMREFRQQMLIYHMAGRIRCISAHVPFSPAAHNFGAPGYRFVTILRDPVQRFVSHYFHSLNRNDYSRISVPFEEFVKSDQARRFGSVYSEYLCGLRATNFSSDETIEAAIENLGKFDAIGFLDELPKFEEKLSSLLGVRLRIKHENAGKSGNGFHNKLPPNLYESVIEICAPDIRIYEAARRMRRGDQPL